MKKLFSFVIAIIIVIMSIPIHAVTQNSVRAPFVVSLFGIKHSDGQDRTGWQRQAAEKLKKLPNASVYKYTAFSNYQLGSYSTASDILMIHTHGNPTTLWCVSSNGAESYLTVNNFNTYVTKNLNRLKVAFLGGCSTGGGGASAQNITNKFFSKGAKCVIGYLNTVYTYCNYTMLESFAIGLGSYKNIQQSLAYADSRVLAIRGTSGYTNQRLVRGSVYQRFDTPGVFDDGSLNLKDSTGIVVFDNELGEYGFYDASKVIQPSNKTLDSSTMLDELLVVAEAHLAEKTIDNRKYAVSLSLYSEDTGLYSYVFDNKVNGIKTADYVTMVLNYKGEIVSFARPAAGHFDNIRISAHDVERASTRLNEHMLNMGITDYFVDDQRIVWQDGKLCMDFAVGFTTVVDGMAFDAIESFIIEIGG